MVTNANIDIASLWDNLSRVFDVSKDENGHEYMLPTGLTMPTANGKRSVKVFARHHTDSDIFEVETEHGNLKTTNDHTLMVFDGQRKLSQLRCSEVDVGDDMYVMSTSLDGCRRFGTSSVDHVRNIGHTDDWVYDFEMEGDDDASHTYFANGILVHNSQFVSLEPIVKSLAKKKGLDENTLFMNHTHEFKEEVIKIFDDLIYNEINPFVANLINTTCHTTQGHRLKYSHEYTTDLAYYQAKKCYLVHIFETEGKWVDKWKQSGIRTKKLGIPVKIKDCLKHVYYTTLQDVNFGEVQYLEYLDSVYHDIYDMDFETIAQFSNYKTEKQAISFCQSVKGAGGVPRAVNNFNDILKEEKLDHKYQSIQVGDEIQWVYLDPNNKYGIDVIAFKGHFPSELKKIFKVDSYKMFDKLINNTLERFNLILGYTRFRPGLCTKDELDLL